MHWRLLGVLMTAAALPAAAAPEPATRPARNPRVTPVVEAYRKASPAVVNISTVTPVQMGWRLFGGEDDPFEEFLPKFFHRTVPVTSLGSGFLIHDQGYVVTNAHVVRRARKITVTLSDESSFEAEVVAANSEHDLAVLRIREAGKRTFPFLRLGRSDDLMIGETVIAIGNPLGYQNTCTTGVLSALNRKLEFRGGLAYDHLIQIDAPINPGSSGGPLLNAAGGLIGINTAIRADAQGIGFAIPVDLLTEDLPRLLDFERLNRVVFGLRVARQHAAEGERIVVASVEPGSPAAAAGCKVGDRLAALDGQELAQLPEYLIAMLRAKPGQTVRLRCRRDDRWVQAAIEIRARPKPDGAALAQGLFGLELKEITPELARQLGLPVEAGLLVTDVEAGSPAGQLGLRRGDIVFQIGRWYTPDLEMVGAILEDVTPGTAMQIGIIRGRVRAWAAVKVRKPPATTRPAPRLRI